MRLLLVVLKRRRALKESACIKPSRSKASSYAGLQAAAAMLFAVVKKAKGAQALLSVVHQSSNDLKKQTKKHVKYKLIKNVINNLDISSNSFNLYLDLNVFFFSKF